MSVSGIAHIVNVLAVVESVFTGPSQFHNSVQVLAPRASVTFTAVAPPQLDNSKNRDSAITGTTVRAGIRLPSRGVFIVFALSDVFWGCGLSLGRVTFALVENDGPRNGDEDTERSRDKGDDHSFST